MSTFGQKRISIDFDIREALGFEAGGDLLIFRKNNRLDVATARAGFELVATKSGKKHATLRAMNFSLHCFPALPGRQAAGLAPLPACLSSGPTPRPRQR